MDGGEWETALGTYDEPWEDQSWEEPEDAEVLDDWTDELPPEDPELEDQFGSLKAAEAYAVTEFINASSDMRNATRTFMEAKDLVSRVKHARGYFPVVGVGAFDGFQTITPRGSRQTGVGIASLTLPAHPEWVLLDQRHGVGTGPGLGLRSDVDEIKQVTLEFMDSPKKRVQREPARWMIAAWCADRFTSPVWAPGVGIFLCPLETPNRFAGWRGARYPPRHEAHAEPRICRPLFRIGHNFR